MCELGSEVAVVGEQEHTGGVAVEASHGVDAFFAGTLHEVHHGFASVGVVAGGHTIFWFIEQKIHFAFAGHDFVVVFHRVFSSDFHTELGHGFAVYLHQSFGNQFVGFTA